MAFLGTGKVLTGKGLTVSTLHNGAVAHKALLCSCLPIVPWPPSSLKSSKVARLISSRSTSLSSPDTRLAQGEIPSLVSLTIVSAVFSEELVTVYSRPLAVEKPVPF